MYKSCIIPTHKSARFLEDWKISGGFADNLCGCDNLNNYGLFAQLQLFVQLQIIPTISQISCGIEDTWVNTFIC